MTIRWPVFVGWSRRGDADRTLATLAVAIHAAASVSPMNVLPAGTFSRRSALCFVRWILRGGQNLPRRVSHPVGNTLGTGPLRRPRAAQGGIPYFFLFRCNVRVLMLSKYAASVRLP